ncbi:MAG TPA: hypothetical protein VFD73_12355 [Gemmatimonadales bacterium]|nr:hypothetical protein [Gemmatimonadales bacterium]
MLQAAKFPSELRIHRIWEPMRASDDRRPIAFVTERRRRSIGAGVMAVGLLEVLAILLLHLAVLLIFVGVLISLAGGLYANGGRAGFYEVEADGSLGAYLGRARPDLGSMRSRGPGA